MDRYDIRVGTEALSSYLLPCILYNMETCMYEHLMVQDGFSPLSQREKRIPSMLHIRSDGARVD